MNAFDKPVGRGRWGARIPAFRPIEGMPFSRREREVGDHVVEGLTNQEIASELGISVKTVEAHLAHMHLKAGTRGRVRLAFWWYFERMPIDDLMRAAGLIA